MDPNGKLFLAKLEEGNGGLGAREILFCGKGWKIAKI